MVESLDMLLLRSIVVNRVCYELGTVCVTVYVLCKARAYVSCVFYFS